MGSTNHYAAQGYDPLSLLGRLWFMVTLTDCYRICLCKSEFMAQAKKFHFGLVSAERSSSSLSAYPHGKM